MARDNTVLDADESVKKTAESGEIGSNNRLLDRRSYLKLTGVAASVAAINPLSSAAAATDARSAPEAADPSQMTERVLDVTDGDDLASHVANSSDGELLVVPSGTYEWNRQLSFSRTNWGIRGDGDVTIMVPSDWGRHGQGEDVLNVSGDNVLLDNLTFDSDGRPGVGFRCIVNNVATIRDIEIACDGPTTWDQHTYAFRVGAESSSGHLEMDGIVCQNNGDVSNYNGGNGRVGVWCSRAGKLSIRNSVLAGFPNNAVYTRMRGPMVIENCVFANNSPTSVRLGGKNEVIRDCTFYTDLSLDGSTHSNNERQTNVSAIMADNRSQASNGGYVENCSFIFSDAPNASGVIRFLENEWVDFTDCQFLLDVPHIPAFAWHSSGRAQLNNVSFHTSNDSGATVGTSGGSYDTTNVGVNDGLSSGSVSPDYSDTAFDWDRAHSYPNPDLTGDGGNDDTTEPDAHVTISIDGTNAPVTGGEELEVAVSLENTGGSTVERDIVLLAGPDSQEVVSTSVTIGPDGTETTTLSYETEPVDAPAELSVTVETSDGSDTRTVEVVGSGDGEEWKTLTLDGEGSSEKSNYRIEVDGEIERSEELSEYGTGGEFVDDSTLEGFVRGGVDGFRFTGELTALEVEEGPTVAVDGQVVDPDEYGSETPTWAKSTLVIDGEGSSEVSNYRIEVDGEIERSEALSEYGTGGEFVDDSTLEGFVRGGVDGFRFTGELAALEIEDGPTISVNGVVVDPRRIN
ncbi:right-handed parallel beta-helix repeat-containing protein [Natrinema sp. HArc-T2]|uniref:right-handed parallel beta-helix repeat-containing protein n=1 Tax=Natrinema sp. HArc-T2 TaxID=3242701 RepID=UPI00359CE2F2